MASVKNGEKKQMYPQSFGGRLCRKKPVAADGKTTRKKLCKGQVLQKILAASKPFCKQNLAAGKVLFGEKRAGKAFATG